MRATVTDLLAGSTSTVHTTAVHTTAVHTTTGSTTGPQLLADGSRLADHWSAAGIQVGDRVAVYADNSLGYLRCIAAAAVGRFVLVSVNRRYSESEATRLVERSGARLLVTDADLRLPDNVDRSDIAAVTAAESTGAIEQAERSTPDDPFVVFTTSGTTSEPKMVLHRQRSIAEHAPAAARRIGCGADDRVLVALPLCGVFGFNAFTIALAGNAQIWLLDRFDTAAAAAAVEQHRITVMNGSDDMFHRMLDTDHDLSSLRCAPYGRFNPSLDGIVERADRRGARLTGVYGMSEVQALCAVRDPALGVADRSLAGGTLSAAEATFRIVEPESGVEVSPGESGELQLAGPSLFAGYLAEGGEAIDVDRTAAAHDIDDAGRHWFRTGDLARAEADGTMTFLTRMGDVLRLGGFLVNPAEIETVVLELDGIDEAVAVALPRPEGVRAVVAVVSDHEPDQAAVIAHCRKRLARYKVPIGVLRVDEMPTTPSANGTKIRVTELRDLAIAAFP